MATWKKVIVSGSNASLNQVNVSTNQQISGSAVDTRLSGSFSGSFSGDGSALTGVVATAAFELSQSTGIVPFSYNGNTTAVVAVSGAAQLSDNAVTKWNATDGKFVNSSLTDNGTTISGTTSIQLSGANSSLTGSFSGSFTGLATNATSASYAVSASYAANVPATSSYALQALTASYANVATSASHAEAADAATSASHADSANSASHAENADNATSASYAASATSASYSTYAANAGTAVNANTASYLGSSTITNNTDNYILTATGGGSINGEQNLTFDGTTLGVTGNVTISNNLTVAGTASFYNQTSLEIADKFVVVASGSNSLTDGGIIVAAGGVGGNISGSAFFLESTSTGTGGRFAVAPNVHATASSVVADEFVVSAKQASGAPASDPTWGGSGNGFGNIYVDSATGDIYIYS